MSNMFFAKFNLSSNIHKAYKDNQVKTKTLQRIIAGVNQNRSITDVYNNEFKFCELIKDVDNMYIAGRLVKIYEDEIETYNRADDTTDSSHQKDLANTVTFYFDVAHEEIAFCPKRGFGRTEFIDRFKLLLEDFFEDLEFEIIIEQNFKEFESIVQGMHKVLSAKLTLIPPNDPNYDKFKEIYGRSFEEIEETKSTKYIQEIQVSKKSEQTINTSGAFFKNSYFALANGYGKMIVEDFNGYKVSSEEKAPYKEYIGSTSRDIVTHVIESGKKYILKLLQTKNELIKDDITTAKRKE